jgi:hypothetical protein
LNQAQAGSHPIKCTCKLLADFHPVRYTCKLLVLVLVLVLVQVLVQVLVLPLPTCPVHLVRLDAQPGANVLLAGAIHTMKLHTGDGSEALL